MHKYHFLHFPCSFLLLVLTSNLVIDGILVSSIELYTNKESMINSLGEVTDYKLSQSADIGLEQSSTSWFYVPR